MHIHITSDDVFYDNGREKKRGISADNFFVCITWFLVKENFISLKQGFDG